MTHTSMLLDKIPDPEDFYKNYWNKKPFIVKKAIDESFIDNLLDADDLAGLSLEEDVRSRIIRAYPEEKNWKCQHGSFDEDIFETLGEKNWSLLVQNVDQHIPETSTLLNHFNFSPRWMIDDIMVGYSCEGGSVGAHIDSYHVFLIQGKGKRIWKIGREAILEEEYIDNIDLKVLKHGFEGEEFEITCGDVIYIPPNFGHEGITIDESLTFSIGFLGPTTSEILVEYGLYISKLEKLNKKYSGKNINMSSSSSIIDKDEINNLRSNIIEAVSSDHFNKWLVSFFSTPNHIEEDEITVRNEALSPDDIFDILKNGGGLYKEKNTKIISTKILEDRWVVAFNGKTKNINDHTMSLISKINAGEEVRLEHVSNHQEINNILSDLYNNEIVNVR